MCIHGPPLTEFRMEDSPADQLLWPVLKHFLYADRSAGAGAEVETLRACASRCATVARAGRRMVCSMYSQGLRLGHVIQAHPQTCWAVWARCRPTMLPDGRYLLVHYS